MSDPVSPGSPSPDRRVSDADRERAAEQVQAAVADGRLGLDELDARIGAALAARTRSDLDAVLADLGPDPKPVTPSVEKLTATGSALNRDGRWRVPARLVVEASATSVILDFTEAEFTGPDCHLEVDLSYSSLQVVMPDDVAFESTAVPRWSAVNVKRRQPVLEPRATVRLSGELQASSVSVRRAGWRKRRRLAKALAARSAIGR